MSVIKTNTPMTGRFLFTAEGVNYEVEFEPIERVSMTETSGGKISLDVCGLAKVRQNGVVTIDGQAKIRVDDSSAVRGLPAPRTTNDARRTT